MIANVIYLILSLGTSICAYLNRHGKFKNYFELPLYLIGLRMSIRLLDLEQSLKIISKDQFILLIASNSFSIICNFVVQINFFKHEGCLQRIFVHIYVLFCLLCVMVGYYKVVEEEIEKSSATKGVF